MLEDYERTPNVHLERMRFTWQRTIEGLHGNVLSECESERVHVCMWISDS